MTHLAPVRFGCETGADRVEQVLVACSRTGFDRPDDPSVAKSEAKIGANNVAQQHWIAVARGEDGTAAHV